MSSALGFSNFLEFSHKKEFLKVKNFVIFQSINKSECQMIWQGNEKEEDDDENGYLQKERESSHLLKGAELGAHFVRKGNLENEMKWIVKN